MFLESTWTWLAERWVNMADLAERVDDLICSFDSSGDTTMDTLSMLIFGWLLFGLIVLCVGKFLYNHFVLNEKIGGSGHSASGASASGAIKDHGIHGIGECVVSAGSIASKLLTQDKPIKVAMAKSATASANASHVASAGVIGATAHSTGGGGTAGGYVPPTPPMRKRLTRKPSGSLMSPARSSRALHLPAATGADTEAVRWVNELVVWLHSDLVILNELLATWVHSLNDFVASSVDEVICDYGGGGGG